MYAHDSPLSRSRSARCGSSTYSALECRILMAFFRYREDAASASQASGAFDTSQHHLIDAPNVRAKPSASTSKHDARMSDSKYRSCQSDSGGWDTVGSELHISFQRVPHHVCALPGQVRTSMMPNHQIALSCHLRLDPTWKLGIFLKSDERLKLEGICRL